jgi:hypothetical protein
MKRMNRVFACFWCLLAASWLGFQCLTTGMLNVPGA